MFKYAEILGIKSRGGIKNVENIDNYILLCPDSIIDTINKINELGYDRSLFPEEERYLGFKFINGYGILPEFFLNTFINKRGMVITAEKEMNCLEGFFCDRARAAGEKGYIDGLTGKFIPIEANAGTYVVQVGLFSRNIAPVKYYDSKKRNIL